MGSAIAYGFYSTFLKVKVPKEKEETFKFSWFLGFVGFFNDFLLLPLFPIFSWIGLEPFEWPNSHTIILLSANAFIGTFVSDYTWAQAVVRLGPLITTLGLTLTFPISLFVDILFNGASYNVLYYLGSFLIFGAFGVIAFIDYKETEKEEAEKKLKQSEASGVNDSERESLKEDE